MKYKLLWFLVCLLVLQMACANAQPFTNDIKVLGSDMLFVDIEQVPGHTISISFPVITKSIVESLNLAALYDDKGILYPFKLPKDAEPFLDSKRVVLDGWHEYIVYFSIEIPEELTHISSGTLSIDGNLYSIHFEHFALKPIFQENNERSLHFSGAPLSLGNYLITPSEWELFSDKDITIQNIYFTGAQKIDSAYINNVELINNNNSIINEYKTRTNEPLVLTVNHSALKNQRTWTYTYINLVIEFSLKGTSTKYALPVVNFFNKNVMKQQLEEYITSKLQ